MKITCSFSSSSLLCQFIFKNEFWDIENKLMVTSGERTGGGARWVQETKRYRPTMFEINRLQGYIIQHSE